jgi:hypothetical protein
LLYLRAMRAEAVDAPPTDDPGTALAKDLAMLGSVAWRARQRAHQGLRFDTTYRHIDLCAAWRSARGAFDELAGALLEVLVDAGSDDPDSRPQTA